MHKFSMKELGFPDVCTDTRFNKAVLANEIRNGSYPSAFVQKM
ncbi:60S ribosomal protein L31 [Lemmus lemmus]